MSAIRVESRKWRLRVRRAAYRGVGWRVDRRFESRVCWILGHPRSGSSWLLGLLSYEPRVLTIDEPLIGHNLAPFLATEPGFDPVGLGPRTFTMRLFNGERDDEFFSDRYRDAWLPPFARLVRRRVQAQLATQAHDPRRTTVFIKEPNGSQSADLLMAATPESRLLFLYRDPRDAIDSELDANRPGSWVTRTFPGAVGIAQDERVGLARLAAHRWLMRIEMVEAAFERHRGPKLRLRYEDLLGEPELQLSAVLSWAGLDFDAAEVARRVERLSFEGLGQTGSKEFARSADSGSWRTGLSAIELAVIDEITEDKRRQLGYDD